MELRILISIVFVLHLALIGRSLAGDPQAEPEVTTISAVTEDVKIELPSAPIERSGHVHVDPTFKGFWAKKFTWRPRWVKTWQEKKVYLAVWKRMWGPVEVKEWVPLPKPPPGWVRNDVESYIAKKIPLH